MKGKDIVGQKGPFFSSFRQRPKSLLDPAFGSIEQGLAGFFTRPTPVLAPVWRFGVLWEPPSPQNRR